MSTTYPEMSAPISDFNLTFGGSLARLDLVRRPDLGKFEWGMVVIAKDDEKS